MREVFARRRIGTPMDPTNSGANGMKYTAKRLILASVVAVVACMGTVTSAYAQGGGGPRGGGGMAMRFMGGGMDFTMNAQQLEGYGKILGLTPEQAEAAKSLLQGHQEAFSPKRAEFDKAMETAREEFRESRDPSVFEGLRAKGTELADARVAAEKAFLADFKAMLTPDQQAKWPRVERAQRRDTTMSGGMIPFGVAGDRVDLFKLAGRVAIPEEIKSSKVDPILERYELELDPALTRRNEIMEQGMQRAEEFMRMFQEGKRDELDKRWNEAREAMTRLRDINKRYSKEIEAALPAELATKWSSEYRREAYPQVYGGQRNAQRRIDAALAMEDLTEAQKQGVNSVKETFTRENDALNTRAEKATDERDNSMTLDSMMNGGFWGGGGNEAMNQIRDARRTLEEKTNEQLNGVLTPEQVAKLPAVTRGGGRGQGGPGGGAGGGMGGGGRTPRGGEPAKKGG